MNQSGSQSLSQSRTGTRDNAIVSTTRRTQTPQDYRIRRPFLEDILKTGDPFSPTPPGCYFAEQYMTI